MLSRDERARPEWVELEQYVIKVDPDVRGSFVSQNDQIRNQNTSQNSLPKLFGHDQPQDRPLLYQPVNSQSKTSFPDNTLPTNGIKSSLNRPPPVITGSDRIVVSSKNMAPLVYSGVSSTVSPVHFNPISNYNIPIQSEIPLNSVDRSVSGKKYQKSNINPVLPSNINSTRPLRNIFPNCNYVSSTKIDENLIVVPDDDR